MSPRTNRRGGGLGIALGMVLAAGAMPVAVDTAAAGTTCKNPNPQTGDCEIKVEVPGGPSKPRPAPKDPGGGGNGGGGGSDNGGGSGGGGGGSTTGGDGGGAGGGGGSGGGGSGGSGGGGGGDTCTLEELEADGCGGSNGGLEEGPGEGGEDRETTDEAPPPPPPNPEVGARMAMAQMNLRAPKIGIVPEDTAGKVGIVGMPTWMWVADRGPSTWGPQTKSVELQGYKITATAKVGRTVWHMGDGKSVTCTSPGTPYADSYGKQKSPDCGHSYKRQGKKTVTVVAYWTIEWSGVGQTGTIDMQLQRSTTITVGEAQVLN